MSAPRPRKLVPPPDSGAAAGGLAGLLGGLGGAITCLCCLAAFGLIGLWVTFIPFVTFFRYAYDQQVRADGGGVGLQNLQQAILLTLICLLSIGLFKRQIST